MGNLLDDVGVLLLLERADPSVVTETMGAIEGGDHQLAGIDALDVLLTADGDDLPVEHGVGAVHAVNERHGDLRSDREAVAVDEAEVGVAKRRVSWLGIDTDCSTRRSIKSLSSMLTPLTQHLRRHDEDDVGRHVKPPVPGSPACFLA